MLEPVGIILINFQVCVFSTADWNLVPVEIFIRHLHAQEGCSTGYTGFNLAVSSCSCLNLFALSACHSPHPLYPVFVPEHVSPSTIARAALAERPFPHEALHHLRDLRFVQCLVANFWRCVQESVDELACIYLSRIIVVEG